MEGGAFSTEQFKNFSDQFTLYVKIVSRIEGDVNEDQLYKLVGRQAYPTVLFLDSDGELLGKLGSTRTIEAMKGMANKGITIARYKKMAKEGDRNALIEVTIARLEINSISFEEASKVLPDQNDFSVQQKERWGLAELSNQIHVLTRGIGRDTGARKKAAEKMYALYKDGKRPVTDGDILNFWNYVLLHAESIRDVDAYELGIESVRERYGKRTGYWKKWFAKHEATLKKLKAEGK